MVESHKKSIRHAYRSIVEKLKKSNIPSPELDARLLLSHCLNLPIEKLILNFDNIFPQGSYTRLSELVSKRVLNEPMAYILGKKDFWKHEFLIEKDILIPRPDTEILIEAVLKTHNQTDSQIDILDLGTGSGCILLSLLHEFKNAQGIGVDLNEAAIKLAQKNAVKLNVENRSSFILSNWDEAIPSNKKFDIIVSNPPYISQDEYETLESNVKDYESQRALLAQKEGLEHYIFFAENIKKRLKTNGLLAIEIGFGQENAIKEHFQIKGWKNILSTKDLNNIPRCLIFTIDQ